MQMSISGKQPDAARLLVVDDEIRLLRSLQELLVLHGYQTELAQGGRQAIERLDNDHFDAILLDLRMEDISGHLPQIDLLEQAIKQRRYISALYKNGDNTHTIKVKPLKLANFEGFWYLITMEDDVEYVKKYHLKSLSGIAMNDMTFTRSPKLDESLENAMGIWFRIHKEPFEVRLSVSAEIAKFFRRKPLSKTQVIHSVGTDGSMELLVKVTHEMEIIPIVQYWMPNMRVIEPEWVHEKILENIKKYNEK